MGYLLIVAHERIMQGRAGMLEMRKLNGSIDRSKSTACGIREDILLG